MKATLFVSLLLSLGVSATPAVDTTTIEDGGYTYTGIDKTVTQESVSVQEITAAGLVAAGVCSASLDLALDSVGPKRLRLLSMPSVGLDWNPKCIFNILTGM
ncbi:hypothetical protein FVEN_g811 [Fusarium venenatum]|uniref:uncharacterized protein n=1 Tax=Fusarium venenatum TaxID=56646 RepID=UPI001D9F90D9|nr:hypothetical protein FVEN_g811 [Fusarium venenatum]KAH6967359.1 hypothetical protein EDB82DRAFT_542343 [Fusarium venenatum]